ncbi:Rho guanine nucleotide exchange factor [Marasmius tenuissimus]|uniref:Rho guanine nucleotide exchange factor n=1 Tax=Marasmius tenuissimus TaxID=585030 RepID=A0ABR2ZL81_9AGAR
MASLTDQEDAHRFEGILGDKEQLRVFLRQKDEDAQDWLDKLQRLIDNPNLSVTPQFRSSVFTIMVRLSKLSGLHPRCLSMDNVHKVGKYPVAAGAFGDVWKGIIGQSESEGQLVCLKVSKVYVKSDLDALFREYLREALVWRQLKHPNVLPFLGIFYLKDDRQFCLISPWMKNGNLLQYLKATERANVDHTALVHDVAAGLAYLHGEKVVHGDLKGLNILITLEGRASIGDFGLSRIADTLALHLTTSTTHGPAGTARWLAREILNGDSGPTKESDIYAFACVCYEPIIHSPSTGPHGITRTCDGRLAGFNADTEASDFDERAHSSSPPVQNFTSVQPVSAPLKDAEFIHPDSSPHQGPSLDQDSVAGDQDRVAEQAHQPCTSKNVASNTISSEADFYLLLHELPADNWEPRWRPQIRPSWREQSKRAASAASSKFKVKKEGSWLSKWTSGGRDNKEISHNDAQGELTRLIGFLTATASEDWALILDVCERASTSEANAKAAILALRRQFKYGQPQAQLSAARLWAIMLQNSSDTFISQSTSHKFLETLEELCSASAMNPIVKERVLDALAAAAFVYSQRIADCFSIGAVEKDTEFCHLWKKVKPDDKPEEGVPFNMDDVIFSPSVLEGGDQRSHAQPQLYQQPQSHLNFRHHAGEQQQYGHDHKPEMRADTGNQECLADEDNGRDASWQLMKRHHLRRLFNECMMGKSHASVLSQALARTTTENFFDMEGRSDRIIREFRMKCMACQELIAAQIPWASAGSERSRREVNAKREAEGNPFTGEEQGKTTEERLLEDLLATNEELLAALRRYKDLERAAKESQALKSGMNFWRKRGITSDHRQSQSYAERMDANQELTRLEEIFNDKERLASFLGKKGDEAQHWLDRLQLVRRNGSVPLRNTF